MTTVMIGLRHFEQAVSILQLSPILQTYFSRANEMLTESVARGASAQVEIQFNLLQVEKVLEGFLNELQRSVIFIIFIAYSHDFYVIIPDLFILHYSLIKVITNYGVLSLN